MIKVLELLEEELPKYIHDVKSKHQENAKAFAFSSFIQRVFGVESENLDFEKSIKTEAKQMRGRIDAVFGNIIIEFKKDLEKGLETAKEELQKYFQAYLDKGESNFIGIANDGIHFKVFYPVIESNEIVDVEEIDELDLEKSNAEQIFLWFDSYFFSTEKIIPTSADIKRRFGLDSPTFASIHRKLSELFEKTQIHKPAIIKYESWNRYLEIVYGDKPNEKKLFFKHTYLSTFVKLLVHVKITRGTPGKFEDIVPILYGNTFTQAGIKNFMEEDFFSWILSPPIKKQSSKIFQKLLQEIYVYDLDKINEDVLKELYQELVDPDVRKLLGEFYTPDWLAQLMVNQVLDKDATKSIMDPSCGSGTFLFKTIQFKIEKLLEKGWTKDKILEHIIENVIGFDVHPLAVIIARTNYLLALRDILHAKRGSFSIPVYLSDSLKIPTKRIDVSIATPIFEFTALDKKFQFPISVASNLAKMDEIVEVLREHGQEFELKIENSKTSHFKFDPNEFARNSSKSFENMVSKKYNEEETKILVQALATLYELIRQESDAIWPYVLRNMYKPIAITFNKIDIIIGNPPWIAQQAMKDELYQNYLKQESKKYDLIDMKKIHNIPNLELASLFFCHCADQYLKENGTIAFVLPRSVLDASQHENFRKFNKPEIELKLVYDLNDVEPLFRIPSCVLIGKKGGKTEYPVDSLVLSGKIPTTNAQLNEAESHLKKSKATFSSITRIKKNSYYHKLVTQGAHLIPRNFWFVEIKSDSLLGFNPKCPHIISAENKYTRPPWDKIRLDGNVEKEFLFNTIVATDLIPFGVIKRKLIFLPIFIKENKVEMVSSADQPELTQTETGKYLKKVEEEWIKNSTGKAGKMTPYSWINYNSKITKQDLTSRFKVLYIASGTYLTSCVINPSEKYEFNVDGSSFIVEQFIADVATYYYQTNNKEEAYYFCAILNSKILDDLIKPEQSKGNFGPRNIHKLPLTFDIPKFDPSNTYHKQLSEIGLRCEDKVKKILPTIKIKDTGSIRRKIRDALEEDYKKIDENVEAIFQHILH